MTEPLKITQEIYTDRKALKKLESEYQLIIDDVYRILETATDKEGADTELRKNWLPNLKAALKEVETLRECLIKKYKREDWRYLEAELNKTEIDALGPRGENEWTDRLIRLIEVEAHFGINQPPPIDLEAMLAAIMARIEKEKSGA